MTLGVDAGSGAAGRPSTDGSVGAGGAAGEESGAPQSWRARRRRGWRHGGGSPYCVILVPVLPGIPAPPSSTLADESKFVAASRVQPGRWKMQEPSSSSA